MTDHTLTLLAAGLLTPVLLYGFKSRREYRTLFRVTFCVWVFCVLIAIFTR